MKILIVGFFDDNFGDMLIRICFKNLLITTLKNINIDNYTIDEMALKQIDENKIKNSDIIFFAGGGLFGISYLGFSEYLDKITSIAEKKKIPVIFSSMGVNNMDATDDNTDIIKNILNRKCIKYISVRENKEYFLNYTNLDIKEVCDPGLWAQYVYNISKKKNKNICIGLNVARGGLFKANGKNWSLKDEMNYLNEMKTILEKNKIDYQFYTNGSVLDNITLRYFVKIYNISKDKVIYSLTTRSFVDTVSKYDATISIRMHSSITSYSFNIPSFNIVWNDKLKYFYKAINHPERAIEIEDWNAKDIYNKLKKVLNNKKERIDTNYLMSLYEFLYNSLLSLYPSNKDTKIFTFKEVVEQLKEISVEDNEDVKDLYVKINKAEEKYLSLFEKNKDNETNVKQLTKEIKNKDKKIIKLQEELDNTKKRLNKFYRFLPIRIYRKIKRTIKNKVKKK